MADLRVKVRLTADSSDAEKGANKAGAAFKAMFARIAAGAASIGAAILGFSKLLELIEKTTDAASIQETAVTKLDSALSRAGPGAASYSDELQRQASELQKLGQAGDEVIISTQALLAEMGVAPQQIGKATEAALDLSASLGLDLNSAARNVGKTVGGFAGELGELIPELKDLSTEALQAGEGIDLLADKFKGAASDAAETYAASLKRISDAQGDVLEKFGESVTQSEKVAESQLVLASAWETLSGEIRTGDGILSRVQTSWNNLQSLFVAAVINVNRLGAGQKDLNEVTAEQVLQQKALEEQLERTNQQLLDQAAAEAKATREKEEFIKQVERLGVSLEDGLNSEMERNIALLDTADEQYRRGTITRKDFEAIQRKVISANEELNDTFNSQITDVDQLNESYEKGGEVIDLYRQRVERLGSSYRSASRDARELSRSTSEGNGRFTSEFGGAIALGTGNALRTNLGSFSTRRSSANAVTSLVESGRYPSLATRLKTSDAGGGGLNS